MHRLFYREDAGRPPRVRWALEEVGAPYEWVALTREELDSPEHRARHPLGKVPALEDHEGTLYESAALCLHVADTHPEADLIGALGTRGRALVYQWTLFAMSEIEPPMISVLRLRGSAPEVAATALERFLGALAVVEHALTGHDYLVEDRFTAADIVLGGVLISSVRREVYTPSDPIGEYLERLAARPAHRRAYA
jgi:glutathione S-transferase